MGSEEAPDEQTSQQDGEQDESGKLTQTKDDSYTYDNRDDDRQVSTHHPRTRIVAGGKVDIEKRASPDNSRGRDDQRDDEKNINPDNQGGASAEEESDGVQYDEQSD